MFLFTPSRSPSDLFNATPRIAPLTQQDRYTTTSSGFGTCLLTAAVSGVMVNQLIKVTFDQLRFYLMLFMMVVFFSPTELTFQWCCT